jgi:hypothetical protein
MLSRFCVRPPGDHPAGLPMRRPHLTALIILLLAAGFAQCGLPTFRFPQSGHRSMVVSEVSKPFSVSAESRAFGFLNGACYVIVEGDLDGDAVLEITTNRGRDQRRLLLRGPQVARISGGPEEWVGDVQVHYLPTSAKTGRLYVALYCGAAFTPEDSERYSRISRSKP